MLPGFTDLHWKLIVKLVFQRVNFVLQLLLDIHPDETIIRRTAQLPSISISSGCTFPTEISKTLGPRTVPSRTETLKTPGSWRSKETTLTTDPPPMIAVTVGCTLGSRMPAASVTLNSIASLMRPPARGVSVSSVPTTNVGVMIAGVLDGTPYQ